MKTIYLSKRETFGYRSAWAHLDKWSDVGKAALVGSGETEDGGESGKGWALFRIEELEPECTVADAIQALSDEYRFGCKCEHDCCGHRFGGARDGEVVGSLDGQPLVRMATWWALNI